MSGERDNSKQSPELTAALKQLQVQMGYAQPEPVVEEKAEEPVEEKKPLLKEKDDDITTWSDAQLEVLAATESELSKDAQELLKKRGIDSYQSEESKEIKALRKDFSKERSEKTKAEDAQRALEARKALELRVRNGDPMAMAELLGNRMPTSGSLHGEYTVDMANVKRMIEAENKSKKGSK